MAWATSSSTRPPEAAPAPAESCPRLGFAGDWPAQLDRARLERACELELFPPDCDGPGTRLHELDALVVDARCAERALALLAGLPEADPARRPAVVLVRERRAGALFDAGRPEGVDEVADLGGGTAELWQRVEAALRARRLLIELRRKNEEMGALNAQLEALASRLAEELRLAAAVQRSLLPPPLRHPRVDAAWEFLPCREIGGDYFDIVPLEGGRLALALGDVMGKGVPAALLAGNLKACLRAQLQDGPAEPARVVERVNRLYCDVSPRGRFATLFFGILDPEAGLLDFVNAGHDQPLLVRPGGEVERLAEGGTVLGLLPEGRYEAGQARLGAEDLLVLYTDGVTDRGTAGGEGFGLERLGESAGRVRADPARLALYSLLGEVQGHSGGQPPEDDLTLVALKLRGVS